MDKKSSYSLEKDQRETIWLPFVNQETGVYTSSGGLLAIGVLRKPNFDSKFISFVPSLVFEADDEHAHVDYKTPTRLPLQIFEREGAILRPLARGYLEERAKIINRLANKKRGVLGFAEHEASKSRSSD